MRLQHLFLYIILFIFLVPQAAPAQDRDSLAFVQAERQTKQIEKGITWHRIHIENLFESVQEINWIEIDLNKHQKRLHLVADSAELKPTSEFARKQHALIAINGGFFDIKNGGAVDYIRVDNQVINQTKKPTPRGNAVLAFDSKGLRIEPAVSENTEGSSYPNVLLSGPLLLDNSQTVDLDSSPFNNNRHPRSAIGITADNTFIMIVVDGRNRMAQGMNLQELGKIMAWLKARSAMNLDGGGSSTLYVKGATENDIVNHPSDNKNFDHQGERSVANILLLK